MSKRFLLIVQYCQRSLLKGLHIHSTPIKTEILKIELDLHLVKENMILKLENISSKCFQLFHGERSTYHFSKVKDRAALKSN